MHLYVPDWFYDSIDRIKAGFVPEGLTTINGKARFSSGIDFGEPTANAVRGVNLTRAVSQRTRCSAR